jgi:hypothetical protein
VAILNLVVDTCENSEFGATLFGGECEQKHKNIKKIYVPKQCDAAAMEQEEEDEKQKRKKHIIIWIPSYRDLQETEYLQKLKSGTSLRERIVYVRVIDIVANLICGNKEG